LAYRKRRRCKWKVCHSSRSCEWATPQDFFNAANAKYGPFDLDAAATAENAKCSRFYTEADDGLTQPWTGRVWCNPPYFRHVIDAWVKKGWEASQTTAEVVVMLVRAATSTRWWHQYASKGEVEFMARRLRFGDAKSGAPFPSALVVFRPPFRNGFRPRLVGGRNLTPNRPETDCVLSRGRERREFV
jgi:phage N-6-adenine-methyltransferase